MGRRLADRLADLEGKILVPTTAAVQAGRVPRDRIQAVTSVRRLEGPGPLTMIVEAWPVDLTHRGWSHPGLEDFQDSVCRRTFTEAPPRGPRAPAVLPRAHLDYVVADVSSITRMESPGWVILASEAMSAILTAHGVYPRADLLKELSSAAVAALRKPAPASTILALTQARSTL